MVVEQTQGTAQTLSHGQISGHWSVGRYKISVERYKISVKRYKISAKRYEISIRRNKISVNLYLIMYQLKELIKR